MTDNKSLRSQAAQAIQEFILNNDLAQMFDVYHEIDLSLRLTHDGCVRVFSPTKIEVRSDVPHGDGVETFARSTTCSRT